MLQCAQKFRQVTRFGRSLSFVSVSEEVRFALERNKPIVALESTIISHGMPYPQNLEVALQVEAKVREKGAVPATIAIVDGQCKAGLTRDELLKIAQPSEAGPKILKASRRDLSFIIANKLSAGTTVASTMIIAHAAGITKIVTLNYSYRVTQINLRYLIFV